jgi:hypothetical protein
MRIYSVVKPSLILVLLLVSGLLFAQSSDDIQKNDTSTAEDDEMDINLLMVSLSFTNNNIKHKNLDKNIKMPAYTADFSFYHQSGVWTSVAYTNYFDADISTYETELKLGYQYSFLKIFDADFNYTYHHFDGNVDYEGISYDHSLNASLAANSKYLSLITDVYSLHGITDNYFLDLSLSVNIDIDGLFHENDFFLVNPSIMSSFGTDDWIFEDFTPMQGNGRRKFLGNRGYQTDKFEYQSLGFYIPIIYSLNNFSVSFSWFYSIPSKKLQAIDWDDQSGYLISLIYSPNF